MRRLGLAAALLLAGCSRSQDRQDPSLAGTWAVASMPAFPEPSDDLLADLDFSPTDARFVIDPSRVRGIGNGPKNVQDAGIVWTILYRGRTDGDVHGYANDSDGRQAALRWQFGRFGGVREAWSFVFDLEANPDEARLAAAVEGPRGIRTAQMALVRLVQ